MSCEKEVKEREFILKFLQSKAKRMNAAISYLQRVLCVCFQKAQICSYYAVQCSSIARENVTVRYLILPA